MSDVDCAVLLNQAGQPWTERKGFTPSMALNYADGWSGGIGYMEVWYNAPEIASGSSAVREVFTVSGAFEDRYERCDPGGSRKRKRSFSGALGSCGRNSDRTGKHSGCLDSDGRFSHGRVLAALCPTHGRPTIFPPRTL